MDELYYYILFVFLIIIPIVFILYNVSKKDNTTHDSPSPGNVLSGPKELLSSLDQVKTLTESIATEVKKLDKNLTETIGVQTEFVKASTKDLEIKLTKALGEVKTSNKYVVKDLETKIEDLSKSSAEVTAKFEDLSKSSSWNIATTFGNGILSLAPPIAIAKVATYSYWVIAAITSVVLAIANAKYLAKAIGGSFKDGETAFDADLAAAKAAVEVDELNTSLYLDIKIKDIIIKVGELENKAKEAINTAEAIKAKSEEEEAIKKAKEKAEEDIKKAKEKAEKDIKKAGNVWWFSKKSEEEAIKKAKEKAEEDIKKATEKAEEDIKKATEKAEEDIKKAGKVGWFSKKFENVGWFSKKSENVVHLTEKLNDIILISDQITKQLKDIKIEHKKKNVNSINLETLKNKYDNAEKIFSIIEKKLEAMQTIVKLSSTLAEAEAEAKALEDAKVKLSSSTLASSKAQTAKDLALKDSELSKLIIDATEQKRLILKRLKDAKTLENLLRYINLSDNEQQMEAEAEAKAEAKNTKKEEFKRLESAKKDSKRLAKALAASTEAFLLIV